MQRSTKNIKRYVISHSICIDNGDARGSDTEHDNIVCGIAVRHVINDIALTGRPQNAAAVRAFLSLYYICRTRMSGRVLNAPFHISLYSIGVVCFRCVCIIRQILERVNNGIILVHLKMQMG